jgi:hypothetical protein
MVLPKRPSQFCKCSKPAKVCQPCHDALQSQYQELLQAKNDVVRELHQLKPASPTPAETSSLLQAERDTVYLMDLACKGTEKELARLRAWLAWLLTQSLPPGLHVTLEYVLDPSRPAPESSSPLTTPTTPPDQTLPSSASG